MAWGFGAFRRPSTAVGVGYGEVALLLPGLFSSAARPAADLPHQRLEHQRDLHLPVSRVGCQCCQEAGAVAVNAEHESG